MRLPLLLLLGSLAALALPNAARAASAYDNCTGFITSVPAVVSTPGTWCLKQDLSTAITTGDAISVAADDVTIDCNDFTLDGLPGGTDSAALGIHALNRNRLTVRHCTVRGFYRGIHAEGTGGRHLVEHNHTDGSLLVGIKVEGANSMIRDNVVTRVGASTSVATPYSAYGILAFDAGTDIVDNSLSSITVRPGSNANVRAIAMNADGTVERNVVRGLAPDGTGRAWGVLASEPDRMTIRDNTLVGGGHAGWGVNCNGLTPPYLHARERGNVISGFGPFVSDCGDAGDNDVTP